jgi:hypothetical protein
VNLLVSFVFGIIGMAYFVYGKKQAELAFMLAGGTLCIYPYAVSDITVMVVVGVLLMASPFVADRLGF